MAAVQFFGKDATINAFKANGVDTWAIMSGNDLLQTGVGSDELAAYLTMLMPAGSGATYKLRVYRDSPDPDEITSKTVESQAFNFRLYNKEQPGAIGGMGTIAGDPATAAVIDTVNREIYESVRERLAKPAREKEETIWDKIGAALLTHLEDPNVIMGIIGAVTGKAPGSVGIPMKVAGTSIKERPATDEGFISDGNPQVEKLAAALDRLERADPNIVDHLCKLADKAEKDPGQFKFLLKMLDNGL